MPVYPGDWVWHSFNRPHAIRKIEGKWLLITVYHYRVLQMKFFNSWKEAINAIPKREAAAIPIRQTP
jgi:hypothetical protein